MSSLSDKKKDDIKAKDPKVKRENEIKVKKDGREKSRSASKAHLKPIKLYSPPDFPFHNRELS